MKLKKSNSIRYLFVACALLIAMMLHANNNIKREFRGAWIQCVNGQFLGMGTEQMQKTKQRLTRILSENTGKPFAEVAADTERDNYMSAREALAYGLIDKIIDQR